jgi:hypothetical protein
MSRGVAFEAGGSARLLRYDFNALCRVEDVFGCDINSAIALLSPESGAPNMRDVRKLFCAGLGGVVTLEKAGEIIEELGIEKCVAMIGDAFARAFPSGEAAGEAAAGNGPGAA